MRDSLLKGLRPWAFLVYSACLYKYLSKINEVLLLLNTKKNNSETHVFPEHYFVR